MHRITLLIEKKKKLKAQKILKALVRNATSAMFQNKKLKCNATSAIAEVVEVALCASNCALPTSAIMTSVLLQNFAWLSKNAETRHIGFCLD